MINTQYELSYKVYLLVVTYYSGSIHYKCLGSFLMCITNILSLLRNELIYLDPDDQEKEPGSKVSY